MSSNVFMHVSNLNEKLHCACQETKHVCVGQMIEQWNLHKVHQSSAKMHVDFLQLQMFETSFDLQCLAACATMSKQGSDQE